MSRRDDDRFRVRPGAPKDRSQRFISSVLKEASRAGGNPLQHSRARSGAKLGRGIVAAKFAGQSLGAASRRVVIKTRLVNLKRSRGRSTETHLRYIERDGVSRSGEKGLAYGPTTDRADLTAFEERGRGDRHQFRFIVGPEDADQLDDLRGYTRGLMTRMASDLGTSLDWVAVDHWDTDNPHTHIVLRGKAESGRDLVIARDYISHGMRQRASELATEWLGPRTELEIRANMAREIDQGRWTGLDRVLQRMSSENVIRLDQLPADGQGRHHRILLVARLQRLERLGLASRGDGNTWHLEANAESVLRAAGERGDIVRTMQRTMGNAQRELAVFSPVESSRPIVGRIAGKGLVDELHDAGYLIVDGVDGRAHYVKLNARAELSQLPADAIVEVCGIAGGRWVDKMISALAANGLYRTDHHLALLRQEAKSSLSPHEQIVVHVRRLEALRHARIVERVSDGVWRVPTNLAERGGHYDQQRLGGVAVELRSHLSIERQTRAIGATWLDRQLINDATGIAEVGFGRDVRVSLLQRTNFLIEHGLARRRGQRVILSDNLLTNLRDREIQITARTISRETGLTHRALENGARVTGVYRRNVQLASGRFALLDDGISFSLVPWRAAIEERLGQTMAVTVRGVTASWEFFHQRGPTIS